MEVKMKKAIIAKKVGMTQVFAETGELIPVTVLEAGPCDVVQIKTVEKEGYDAIQLSFGEKREKITTSKGKEVSNISKPIKGHYAKAGVAPKRNLKEFRLEDISVYNLGDTVTADIFAAGDKVDISGVSKGKGYQGNIKRHGQSRGPMAHGSKYHRAVGSMGGSSDPSRVFKGKKLPGHMGSEKVTVQNLTVVKVDAELNMILVKGAVPGANGSIITVVDSLKK